MVARRLGATPEPGFAAAAHDQTGGNPFLLDALAGLDAGIARRAAAELATAGLFEDATRPAFAHPLLRAAVEDGMPAATRAGAHTRAARVLDGLGAGRDALVAHLVAAGPGDGDPWAVDQLLDAAVGARARGAPEAAAALLRRALAEPPAAGARPTALLALGTAELARFEPGAAEHLADAVALASDPAQRADAALALAVSRYYAGCHGDAVDVLLGALDDLGDEPALRERRLGLEAFLGVAGRYDLRTEASARGRVRWLAGTLAGETAGERLVDASGSSER